MKILILHHCDSWGGAGVSLRDLCYMLSPVHEVTVCLPHLESQVSEQLGTIKDLKIIAINAPMGMISAYNGGPKVISRTFVKNLFRIQKSAIAFKNIVQSGNYDLIILNSITLAWAAKTVRKMGIPVLMYIRETKVKNVGYKICLKLINRYCSAVAYISEFDRKNSGLKVRNQAVINDCLNFEKYNISITRSEACKFFSLDDKKTNLLYVGGTDELKGYSVIMAAMDKIRDVDVRLIVAGGIANDKKIEMDKVIYVGKVLDMPTLYKACDALVFPSTKGHQARPVFEAGAMGLPVIISNFPETADEVRHDENGLLVEPNNSATLARCIQELIIDRDKMEKMGERNRENAICRHDFNVCQKQMLDFCATIVNN